MLPLRDDNPTRLTPYVTWALVVLNVLVFLIEMSGGIYLTPSGSLSGTLAGWTMVPGEVTRGVDLAVNGPTLHPFFLTLLTSMFLHGSIAHLLGNMLFLIIFGNNIEDALGRVKYVVFYLLCGTLAALTQILWSPWSSVPMLGASGAIAGVLGAYFVLYPKAWVKTLLFYFIPVNLPAWLLLGLWILSQFSNQLTRASMTDSTGSGVAHLAHIGGFIAGMLFVRRFMRDHDRA